MEEIKKSFSGALHVADAERDIDLINQYALKKMTPDEVFAFNVNLCDDQQDRDLEKFSVHALQQMAKLFPGKPMLSDHSWSALRQIGRIYKADVVQDKGVNRLRGSVYMIRSDSTNDIISSIEAGVLKEVSVGCSCRKHTCSECGEDMGFDLMKFGYYCKNGHRKGDKGKDGKPILTVLDEITDAYELSFVAVPAQPGAGTTKGRAAKAALSPDDWASRKQIFEDAIGGKITEEAWNAVVQGKISSKELAAAYRQNAKEEEKPKHYGDIVPQNDYSEGSVRYALIPKEIIPDDVTVAVWKALGFCRKELNLPPITVRWFSPIKSAVGLGLNSSELKTFFYKPGLMGLASRQNPHQILLRYPIDDGDYKTARQKTVFHECWHAFQMKDDSNPLDEENAEWYAEDAFKRYSALPEEKKYQLYYDELLMKDYSKK